MKLLALLFSFLFLAAQNIQAAVVINEFQVEPSGASQWVEIFNTGPGTQDISGWFVDDNGGSEKYAIPSSTILGENNCISFSSGNFNWNTSSSDSARLLNGSTVIDEYNFSSSPGNGVSFGRSPDGSGGFITFVSPTRNNFNSNGLSCLAPPTPTPTSTPEPTATSAPTNTPRPTATPTSAPTPTKTPTPTPKKTPTPTIMIIAETATPARIATQSVAGGPTALVLGTASGEVLGTQEEASPTSRPLLPLAISLLLISLGLGMLSLVFIWKKRSSVSPKAPLKPHE